ncbi:hypothetical protein [Lacipirellula limnantheis]|uniref:hypothetical protein n=1 Tax=Lacipirellula limnantheis TaxID=2528024 RepID=UPI0011A7AA50|nr:hypothetical protein [Lacipirellula limnantheis]
MLRPPPAFHLPPRSTVLQRCAVAWAVAVVALVAVPASALTVQFDYSYDTLGFFGTAENPTPARSTLEFAARSFTPFTDTLSAIQPGGGNSWTARFIDPSTNTFNNVPNLAVPQDTLIVYAIARDLAGAALGQASPGNYVFSGSPTANFSNAVTNRGQGDQSLDFAPWGGVIAVDVRNSAGIARNWNFDLGVEPPLNDYDFYTVVTHELAHLFGFGVSNAFSTDIADNAFVGTNAVALYGGAVPLAGGQHWASGVTSPPFLPGTQPKPSLGPSLTLGERKLFTPLDYAALADIGWQVPPELLGLPADFNGDSTVDGADFLIWQRGYGGFGVTPGDANGDLFVDDIDGWIISNYLGSQGMLPEAIVTARAASAAVPEPAAAALALVGLLVFAAQHRRQSIMNDVTINSCSHANPK